MFRFVSKGVIVGAYFLSMSVVAQDDTAELEKEMKQAMEQAQKLLNNPESRQQALSASPEAQKVDEQMKKIYSDEKSMQLFKELAADVFKDIATEAKGDPDKMKQIAAEARKNPAAFASKMNDKQKAALTELASKAKIKDEPQALND